MISRKILFMDLELSRRTKKFCGDWSSPSQKNGRISRVALPGLDEPKNKAFTVKESSSFFFYQVKPSKKKKVKYIPVGDASEFIPSKKADIAILEEPEHLNWYHHGKRWTDKFSHVVGVVHTNYSEYIKREKNGAIQAFLVKHINNMVTRAYYHKVLRLSAATQDLPRFVICNVHGINPKFLNVGDEKAAEWESGKPAFSKETISDWSGKFQEDEVQFSMQPPLRLASLHSSRSSKPVLLASKLERSILFRSILLSN